MELKLLLTAVISMAGLAILFAGLLGIADRKLRVEKDPKVDEILALLPGINCGACGALSCNDFAEHVVKDGWDVGKCRVAPEEMREKLYAITGGKETVVIPEFPIVHCAAGWDKKKNEAEYKGIMTCGAADLDFGGGMDCEYGCMGFGDCCRVCPFDALHMENGLPVVDTEKCTGCGECAKACPRGIITMEKMADGSLIYVACSSFDNTLRTRKVCEVGCIACGVCEKVSQEGFFKVEHNLSVPDYSKQSPERMDEVRQVAAKCPTKVIKEFKKK